MWPWMLLGAAIGAVVALCGVVVWVAWYFSRGYW